MHERRYNDLTRTMARGQCSRRRLLHVVGGLLAAVGLSRAAAQPTPARGQGVRGSSDPRPAGPPGSIGGLDLAILAQHLAQTHAIFTALIAQHPELALPRQWSRSVLEAQLQEHLWVLGRTEPGLPGPDGVDQAVADRRCGVLVRGRSGPAGAGAGMLL